MLHQQAAPGAVKIRRQVFPLDGDLHRRQGLHRAAVRRRDRDIHDIHKEVAGSFRGILLPLTHGKEGPAGAFVGAAALVAFRDGQLRAVGDLRGVVVGDGHLIEIAVGGEILGRQLAFFNDDVSGVFRGVERHLFIGKFRGFHDGGRFARHFYQHTVGLLFHGIGNHFHAVGILRGHRLAAGVRKGDIDRFIPVDLALHHRFQQGLQGFVVLHPEVHGRILREDSLARLNGDGDAVDALFHRGGGHIGRRGAFGRTDIDTGFDLRGIGVDGDRGKNKRVGGDENDDGGQRDDDLLASASRIAQLKPFQSLFLPSCGIC